MKKDLFVTNNLACLNKPEYKFSDKKWLESIYDEIKQNKLETKVDIIEEGLEKVMINA